MARANLRSRCASAPRRGFVEDRDRRRAAEPDPRGQSGEQRAIVTTDLNEPLTHAHAGHRDVQRIHGAPAAPAEHLEEKHALSS